MAQERGPKRKESMVGGESRTTSCRSRLCSWRAGPGILLPSIRHPRLPEPPIALEVGAALLAVGLVALAIVWTASPSRPLISRTGAKRSDTMARGVRCVPGRGYLVRPARSAACGAYWHSGAGTDDSGSGSGCRHGGPDPAVVCAGQTVERSSQSGSGIWGAVGQHAVEFSSS